MFALAQPNRIKEHLGALVSLFAHLPSDGDGQLDVLQRRQVRDQVARALLPDEANARAAVSIHLSFTHLEQVFPIHGYAPGGRPVQPAEDIHQRRFTAATRANDAEQFAAADEQVQPLQRYHLQVGNFINFHQAVAQNKILVIHNLHCLTQLNRLENLHAQQQPAKRTQGDHE